jgi:hypothetical protein
MENTQLAKGTKVKYRQHTKMARGGSWYVTVTNGTVVGTYGDKLVIRARWGGRTTRETPQDVLEVLTEWPHRVSLRVLSSPRKTYRPTCKDCDWTGTNTTSKVAAQKQAENHS